MNLTREENNHIIQNYLYKIIEHRSINTKIPQSYTVSCLNSVLSKPTEPWLLSPEVCMHSWGGCILVLIIKDSYPAIGGLDWNQR